MSERQADTRQTVLMDRRHLKWPALDHVERLLMICCGISITGFSLCVLFDILTRSIGAPWLWLQEATSLFFVYGSFIGMGVATRRMDHLMLSAMTDAMHGSVRTFFEVFNRLVVLVCALCMLWFGGQNFFHGFGSFRMPSLTPIAWWYLTVPLAGFFIALFSIEQIVNGLRNGFETPVTEDTARGFQP